MKTRKNHSKFIHETFGEPIGDAPSCADDHSDKGNLICDRCGGMLELEGASCSQCGMMPVSMGLDEAFDASSLEPSDQKRIARLQKMISSPITSVSGTPGKKGVTHAKVQGKNGVYLWNPRDLRWEFIPA